MKIMFNFQIREKVPIILEKSMQEDQDKKIAKINKLVEEMTF
jgi:hypothetical protein